MPGLTPKHRIRIVAALPPGKVMPPVAWAEFEEIVIGYHIFTTRHATYDINKHREQRERMGEAIETIILGLCRDDMWPGAAWGRPEALTAISAIRHKVETLAAFHDMWRAFGRRQNPHREFLYWGVMRVWTDHLGGVLRSSKSSKSSTKKESPPYGPLIRFFVACVEPILGEQTPNAFTIASIIKRERKIRAEIEDEKRRRRGRQERGV